MMANIECLLGSFVIIQGIQTSIAMKHYVFVVFKGVGGVWTPPLNPHMKPAYKGHSQKDQKLVFKINYHLMQVKSIAECSKGSILQYF